MTMYATYPGFAEDIKNLPEADRKLCIEASESFDKACTNSGRAETREANNIILFLAKRWYRKTEEEK